MSARGRVKKSRKECRIVGCPRPRRKGQRWCSRHYSNAFANRRPRPPKAPKSVRLLPVNVDRDWLFTHALTEEARLWLAQREDRAELALTMVALAELYRFGYLRMQGHTEEDDGSVTFWSHWPPRFVDEPDEISWMSWTA